MFCGKGCFRFIVLDKSTGLPCFVEGVVSSCNSDAAIKNDSSDDACSIEIRWGFLWSSMHTRLQKNRHQIRMIIISPTAPIGPYCFSSSSQLILTAAFRYFLLSSLSLPDISPIRSRLSPRYRRSSIFFVITLVTSRSSSLSLSRFWLARLSWYVFFVRWMKVSNSTNAYGRQLGER